MGSITRLWAGLGLRVGLGLALLGASPSAWAQDKGRDPVSIEVADALVQDYEPDPAIWLLSDEDTRIYLFGTFHVLPEGFRWRTAQFDAIVNEVDELVVETSTAGAETPLRNLLMPMMSKPNRPKVSDRLSPASAKKWLTLARRSGMPVEQIDTMPLVLSGFFFGISGGDGPGSQRDNGVETVLEAEFEKAGKPIGSIEDAAGVMRSLLAIDEQLLIRELEKQLRLIDQRSLAEAFGSLAAPVSEDGEEEDPLAMEHEWARGELAIEPLFDQGALGRSLHKAVLADRNRAWAGWLEERLEQPGTILLAVGAAHFEGQDSVFDYLAERGLQATRLN